MKKIEPSAIEIRQRQRALAVASVAKWPAIGLLIGGGALLVGRILGPPLAEHLGANAGAGFARGMLEVQEKIAAARRSLNISGWGTYR